MICWLILLQVYPLKKPSEKAIYQ